LGTAATRILANAATARLIAKQMSTGRKLFRFGRSLYCILMIRTLLEEKNQFLQIVGLNSWFWNALWFICDHSLWLTEIGVLKYDPLVSLNRLAAVLMQVFQFLFNTRTLSLYYEEERKLLDELDEVRNRTKTQERSKSLEPYPTKKVGGAGVNVSSVDSKALLESIDPVIRIENALKRVRKAQLNLIPTFLKTLGDIVICFDFGFQWGMPEIYTNFAGVVGGIAGCYIEISAAINNTHLKIKALEKAPAVPLIPPRR